MDEEVSKLEAQVEEAGKLVQAHKEEADTLRDTENTEGQHVQVWYMTPSHAFASLSHLLHVLRRYTRYEAGTSRYMPPFNASAHLSTLETYQETQRMLRASMSR